MKVLITGGAGFIGSQLAERLLKEGCAVRLFDNLEEQVHQGQKPAYLTPEAEFIKGDVRDRAALEKALEGVEAVYHFASRVGVAQSQYEIQKYIDTNVNGTAVLLDILANNSKHTVRKIIVAGSMTCYGEGKYKCPSCGILRPGLRNEQMVAGGQWEPPCPKCGRRDLESLPISEEDYFDCTSYYGISKRDQEDMCRIFSKIYKIPTVTLRYFNVYGPRQSLSNPYTGVLSIFTSRVKNGQAPAIYEDGGQTRDFIYIDDVIEANVAALKLQREDGAVFNVGTGIAVKIGQIACRVIEQEGQKGMRPEIKGQFRKGDVRHCFAATARAREELGFVPRVGLEEGLQKFTEWARNEKARDLFQMANKELLEKRIL